MEMSPAVLVEACKRHGGYAAPRLNDQLFLQCRGFTSIDNLAAYTNLKVLWLEQNAISDLRGLDGLDQLVSLLVQNNTIRSLSEMAVLSNLRILNISHNYLTSLRGLAKCCPQLETLQASHNMLPSLASLEDLWLLASTLTSVDLSFNKIGDHLDPVSPLQLPAPPQPQKQLGDDDRSGATVAAAPMTVTNSVVEFFKHLPNVSVVYLQGNSLVQGIKNYRRSMIINLPMLKYLDERPVFDEERRTTEAWSQGGAAAEREERALIRDEKKVHLTSCVRILTDRLDANREVRHRLTAQWEAKREAELRQLQERRTSNAHQQQLIEMEEFDSRACVAGDEVASWHELLYDHRELSAAAAAATPAAAAPLGSPKAAKPDATAQDGSCSGALETADEGSASRGRISVGDQWANVSQLVNSETSDQDRGDDFDSLMRMLHTPDNGSGQVNRVGRKMNYGAATVAGAAADNDEDRGGSDANRHEIEQWLTRSEEDYVKEVEKDLAGFLDALQPYHRSGGYPSRMPRGEAARERNPSLTREDLWNRFLALEYNSTRPQELPRSDLH